MLTPREIEQKKFTVVRLRAGYDQDEVDDYLDMCANTVGHYMGNVGSNAATQAIPVQPQISPTSLERLLVAAEQAAAATRDDAESEAARIKGGAAVEAARITDEAAEQAKVIVAEGTAERHRQIGELEDQRARLKEKVDELIRAETEVTARMRKALERWNS